jgi:hypothetical protein
MEKDFSHSYFRPCVKGQQENVRYPFMEQPFPAPPAEACLNWLAELLTQPVPEKQPRYWVKRLRSRLVTLINRDNYSPFLEKYDQHPFGVALEDCCGILRGLPPTVGLVWLSAAARPFKSDTRTRVPFSNTAVGGQLWTYFRKESPPKQGKADSDVTFAPMWPLFTVGNPDGKGTDQYVWKQICEPLARNIDPSQDELMLQAMLKAAGMRSLPKGAAKHESVRAAQRKLAGRLQRFHVTLGIAWGLAEAASRPSDFALLVTTLEMLLAAELISRDPGFSLPPSLAEDVLWFLISRAHHTVNDPTSPPAPETGAGAEEAGAVGLEVGIREEEGYEEGSSPFHTPSVQDPEEEEEEEEEEPTRAAATPAIEGSRSPPGSNEEGGSGDQIPLTFASEDDQDPGITFATKSKRRFRRKGGAGPDDSAGESSEGELGS